MYLHGPTLPPPKIHTTVTTFRSAITSQSCWLVCGHFLAQINPASYMLFKQIIYLTRGDCQYACVLGFKGHMRENLRRVSYVHLFFFSLWNSVFISLTWCEVTRWNRTTYIFHLQYPAQRLLSPLRWPFQTWRSDQPQILPSLLWAQTNSQYSPWHRHWPRLHRRSYLCSGSPPCLLIWDDIFPMVIRLEVLRTGTGS